MSLLQDYSTDFPPEVIKRGEDYQRRGAVNILDQGPGWVEAEVEGTRVYRSSIDYQPARGLTYQCSCEYFEDRGPCKHLWALVLQSFQHGSLPKLNGTPVRHIEPDPDAAAATDEEAFDEQVDQRTASGEEEGEDAGDEEGDGVPANPPGVVGGGGSPSMQELRGMPPQQLLEMLRFRPPQTRRPRPAGPAGRIGGASEDAWKGQLDRLSEAMRMRPAAAPRPLAWPAGRRLLYVLDVEQTLDAGLVVLLMQETPKRDGTFERAKLVRLSQNQIAQLPDPTDRRIIQLLNGTGRSAYGSYFDVPLPESFEVDESAYEDMLRTICQTGRCRLRARDGANLTPVTWDDGPAWEFCLQIRPSPGGRYLLLDGSLRRPVPAGQAAAAPAVEAGDDALPGDDDESSVTEDVADGAGVTGATAPAGAAADNAPPRDAAAAIGSGEPRPAGSAKPQAAEESGATDAAAAAAPAPSEPEFESVPLSEPPLLLDGVGEGFVFLGSRVARLRHYDAFPLISALREGEKISVPLDKQSDLLKTLLKFPRLPRLELPPDLDVKQVSPAPRPRLKLVSPGRGHNGGPPSSREGLLAKVTFDYDGLVVDSADAKAAVLVDDGQKLVRRDAHKEAVHLADLQALGFREEQSYGFNNRELRLPLAKMPKAVADLTRKGWTVEADGKLYRSAGQINVSVSSGIDWFELRGEINFDGLTASLPRLLEAVRKGETVVRLDDGTYGLLPEEWLKKYAGLAGLGEAEGDHIKFTGRQIGFLDALLSAMPEARFDETFARARDELMRFGGVEAVDPPDTFVGTLRRYQQEGLGWMAFLRKFAFGGVLADDMGLGKTVQVLALLEARRRERTSAIATNGTNAPGAAGGSGNAPAGANGQPRKAPLPCGPSLVVAPRSLVFNWKAEAAKFSPALRVLDHTAVDRVRSADHFGDYDMVVTTYGTLRRDMSYFKDVRFDYAILDEAQAIKNASSESAKAARLVRADHRLALSGTPVQNHLGELWSLFDFLNPGMMGNVGVFRDLSADAANRDATARELLARSLRPFILRRTKEQVARDLPEKLEQTIYCELEADQRKMYDELRDHYRTSLLDRVAKEGMNKAKIMVLEALLRLRQAACHPGLIDKARTGEPSAKLEVLMDHLAEVVDEGHKVLVFSQFTSLLAIVKDRLDKQQAVYEYLDGRTKDRQARVDRFQTDADCKLFLISLKAGGVGLNLTAADYVFLLDPWWNPAVEAQAIDRAHRIGQTQRVFAYRLIAKDTVEEKVIQLQQNKRDLADAIINADNSLIRGLSREDLEMLLS